MCAWGDKIPNFASGAIPGESHPGGRWNIIHAKNSLELVEAITRHYLCYVDYSLTYTYRLNILNYWIAFQWDHGG